MRYALLISYDGTNYSGWQTQPGKVTIQQTVEEAILSAFGESVKLKASGRTDAGVHAEGQVAHFDMQRMIEGRAVKYVLNRFLPEDIRILKSVQATESFDCNRNAKRKTYDYKVYFSEIPLPLRDRFAVNCYGNFDFSKMESACRAMEGEHDFKCFCASGSSVKTTVRTIYSIKLNYHATHLIISVCGNGFLYNMVRSIAGEILAIGSGQKTLESLMKALGTGDRSLIAKTMPARGLTLRSVEYEEKIFD